MKKERKESKERTKRKGTDRIGKERKGRIYNVCSVLVGFDRWITCNIGSLPTGEVGLLEL